MFIKILKKFVSLYVLIRYPKVPTEYFHFYRDTYLCMLTQLKYFFRDYVLKSKYKKISFSGEFTPDLTFALPFAYWHYKNGTLASTEGAKYTSELYFFSPSHTEKFDERTNEGNYNFETPRILYSQNYNMSKWAPVPLKEKYRNEIYIYEKPILIIANRYNMEWGGPPVSFLCLEMLEYIFNKFQDKYQIIYNRPRPTQIVNDNSEIYDLNEYDWITANFPKVILMDSLYKESAGNANNYNHFQLMVYANSNHFISTHGGTGALASYFGGTNILLSKKGPEAYFQCYTKLYNQLSNARILHAKSDEELKKHLELY